SLEQQLTRGPVVAAAYAVGRLHGRAVEADPAYQPLEQCTSGRPRPRTRAEQAPRSSRHRSWHRLGSFEPHVCNRSREPLELRRATGAVSDVLFEPRPRQRAIETFRQLGELVEGGMSGVHVQWAQYQLRRVALITGAGPHCFGLWSVLRAPEGPLDWPVA